MTAFFQVLYGCFIA